ncbi:hypothetical protein GH714_042565 [Hevea brasiliensis]|uniref:Lon proteolytic domain-containing protein n=1 Tax=Hevea brasiliensis TaxID=3981 RepID=A0A6A6JYR3_HEVBR|nr:hypothetical protein GH714_042565 [Hevea brasiliensis]
MQESVKAAYSYVRSRGRVLPIGGLKEKLLAALRGGITTAIIPSQNKKDIIELPESVTQCMEIVLVSSVDEVIQGALLGKIVPLSEDEVFVDKVSSVGEGGIVLYSTREWCAPQVGHIAGMARDAVDADA